MYHQVWEQSQTQRLVELRGLIESLARLAACPGEEKLKVTLTCTK